MPLWKQARSFIPSPFGRHSISSITGVTSLVLRWRKFLPSFLLARLPSSTKTRVQIALAGDCCSLLLLIFVVPVEGGKPSVSMTSRMDSDRLVEISRVMLPDDANPGGNVHGGTILKMIEEASWIAATKHCNPPSSASNGETKSGHHSALVGALVRVEHMDFHKPMHIGEVAKVSVAPNSTNVSYFRPRTGACSWDRSCEFSSLSTDHQQHSLLFS